MTTGSKLELDLKWNVYIDVIAEVAVRMIGTVYSSRKLLIPAPVRSFYNSQIRPSLEYSYHIWAGSSLSSLSNIENVQKGLHGLVEKILIIHTATFIPQTKPCQPFTSLSLLYDMCTDQIYSCVPPAQNYIYRIRYAIFTVKIHRYSFHVPIIQLLPQKYYSGVHASLTTSIVVSSPSGSTDICLHTFVIHTS